MHLNQDVLLRSDRRIFFDRESKRQISAYPDGFNGVSIATSLQTAQRWNDVATYVERPAYFNNHVYMNANYSIFLDNGGNRMIGTLGDGQNGIIINNGQSTAQRWSNNIIHMYRNLNMNNYSISGQSDIRLKNSVNVREASSLQKIWSL